MVSRRLLFIGDVVAEAGRKALRDLLPELRERHSPDLVVANGENIAGGVGITERTARALLEKDGVRWAVVNLSGSVGLQTARSPFHEADRLLAGLDADLVVVDFHAEVTSEKVAMGWHLDGRV